MTNTQIIVISEIQESIEDCTLVPLGFSEQDAGHYIVEVISNNIMKTMTIFTDNLEKSIDPLQVVQKIMLYSKKFLGNYHTIHELRKMYMVMLQDIIRFY